LTRYQYVWGPAADKPTVEYLFKLAERSEINRADLLRKVCSAFDDYLNGVPGMVCRTVLEEKAVFTLFIGDEMRQFNLTKETLNNLTPRVISVMSSPAPEYY
jgi:hypothetical protein